MDTCAATQDESDVQAANETSNEVCPRISYVELSCYYYSHAELQTSTTFEQIFMIMLFFFAFKFN